MSQTANLRRHRKGMMLPVCLLFLSIAAIGCAVFHGIDNRSAARQSLWEVQAYSLKGCQCIDRATASFRLVFATDDTLVFGALCKFFPDRDVREDVRNRFPRSSAVIVALNTKDGSVHSSRVFDGMEDQPSTFDEFYLSPLGNGDLLAAVGNELMRLSPQLEDRVRRPLPIDASPQERWAVVAQPQVLEALLIRYGDHRVMENHWIGIMDLKDKLVTNSPRFSWPSIVLLRTSVIFNSLDEHDKVFIVDKRGLVHDLCDSCTGAARYAFGKNLILVIDSGPGGSYKIVDLDGNVVHHGKYAGVQAFSSSSGAALANRAALGWGALSRETSGRFTSKNRVVVIDVDQKKEIWNIDIQDQGKKLAPNATTFDATRIALSPSGHVLAIFSGGVIKLFRLQ